MTTRRDFLSVSAMAATGLVLRPLQAQGGEDALKWPPSALLPSLPRPLHLDVADLQSLNGDQQCLLLSLQGLVNKQRPSIYTLLRDDPTDTAWLDTFEIPYTRLADPWRLLRQYRKSIKGAVVYDPNVPDTINLASSLGSLEDAVVATAALAKEYKLPVVHDFTGQFQDKFEAYNWAIDNLWPRLNHRLLIGIGPANTVIVPGTQWTTLLQVDHPVTDASNKQVYDIDLSGLLGGEAVYLRFQDAYSSDGWGPSVQQVTVIADGQTTAAFQPGTDAEKPFLYDAGSSQLASGGWRFADGGSFFIYRFAPPAGTQSLTVQVNMWNEFLVSATNTAPEMKLANPFFRDYMAATQALVFWLDPLVAEESTLFTRILGLVEPNTPYLGWFPGGHENQSVTLCSQRGVPVYAADFFNNATVFAGVREPIAAVQPQAPATEIQNKVYVTLTMSEGDNLQYDQHRMRSLWDDPARGAVPTNWSICPVIMDAAPAILHYYQRTQTPNDLLVAGPSGIGYTYPSMWPAAGLPIFSEATGRYMRRAGMDIIYALNRHSNDTNLPLPDAVAQQFQQDIKLSGILYNWISDSHIQLPSRLTGDHADRRQFGERGANNTDQSQFRFRWQSTGVCCLGCAGLEHDAERSQDLRGFA